jgi:hypothetical protein
VAKLAILSGKLPAPPRDQRSVLVSGVTIHSALPVMPTWSAPKSAMRAPGDGNAYSNSTE